MLSDTSSDYESLLDTFHTTFYQRLRYMALEVVRSVRLENTACLRDMFHVNEVAYEMKWSKIIQIIQNKFQIQRTFRVGMQLLGRHTTRWAHTWFAKYM